MRVQVRVGKGQVLCHAHTLDRHTRVGGVWGRSAQDFLSDVPPLLWISHCMLS